MVKVRVIDDARITEFLFGRIPVADEGVSIEGRLYKVSSVIHRPEDEEVVASIYVDPV